MATALPPGIFVATSIGLTMNAYFSVGSLALTYFAIPAFFLPEDAPLMPPLEFVKKRKENHFRAEKKPINNSGATLIKTKSSPSSTNYLLRQWFHVFAKGMHTYPPFAVGAAASYLYCTVMLPRPVAKAASGLLLAKRGFYALSTLISIGIMVFTLTALKPINSALNKLVEEVVEKEGTLSKPENCNDQKEEAEALIREWGRMNAIRAMIPLAASVCAVVALAIPSTF
jgi:Domain of unknown function (DUF1772)